MGITYLRTLLSSLLLFLLVNLSEGNNAVHPGARGPQKPPRVFCTSDSLMIYHDCRMCVCPKPMKPAKCMRKTCDLRTKQSGQCPPAILKFDDSKLCPRSPNAGCKTDNDCPGQQLCCFDFCNGAQCVNPAPLDPGVAVHGGMGYPSNAQGR